MIQFFHDVLVTLKEFINTLAELGWINVFGSLGIVLVLTLLFIAQFTRGDGFDFRDLVADRLPQRKWVINRSKFFQTGAFFATTWGFCWLVNRNQLSEMFLLIYAAAWIGSEAVNLLVKAKAGTMANTVTQERISSQSVTETVVPPTPPTIVQQ